MLRKCFALVMLLCIILILAACASSPSASYTAATVKNAKSGAESSALVREKTPNDVVSQHLKVLNACDWKGLMAQFPDQVEARFPGGAITKGRPAMAELFAGFVLTPKDGGLCGITFSEESRQVINGTLSVQWVAKADFLAEPYRGSDAYVTDDGLLVGMVSTFNGADLKMKK